MTDQAIRFNSPRAFLDAVKDVGFDFLATANNHCLDRGVVGLEETIRQLDEVGIAHDGTFLTQKSSIAPYLVELMGGVKLSVISCTFGTNSQVNGEILPDGEEWRVALLKKQSKFRKILMTDDLGKGNFHTYIADETSPAAIANPQNQVFMDRIVAKIRRAKEVSDIVIVMPHVGGQYNPGPAAYTKYVVRELKKAGADVVIAGHSHTPHYVECLDECIACYSLGNLCFTPGVGFFVPNVLSEYGIVLHLYVNPVVRKVSKMSFNVVKNIVDEAGCAHARPIQDVYEAEHNVAQRDRLLMEYETVVNRFRGRNGMTDILANEHWIDL